MEESDCRPRRTFFLSYSKFEFTINLKTAKGLRLDIPPGVWTVFAPYTWLHGVTVLVPPFTSDKREAALVQFPGGYIAEIHTVAQ